MVLEIKIGLLSLQRSRSMGMAKLKTRPNKFVLLLSQASGERN